MPVSASARRNAGLNDPLARAARAARAADAAFLAANPFHFAHVAAFDRETFPRKRAEQVIADSRAELERFSANLAVNPAYAFRWSDDAFKAAARLDVATRVLAALDHEDGGNAVAAKIVVESAIAGAKNPSRSTSPGHNLIAEEGTAAWAEWTETFEQWLRLRRAL